MDGDVVIPGVYYEPPRRWLHPKNTYISIRLASGSWHKPIKVKEYFPYSQGTAWRFVLRKQSYTVIGWRGYMPEDWGDHWRIFAVEGKTAPLTFHTVESPGEEYQLLLRQHRDADTLRTLKGKGLPWVIILVIIAIIAIAVIGYQYINKSNAPAPISTPTNTIKPG